MDNNDNRQTAIIFGAGNAGMAAAQNLSTQYSVVAFCDNDPTKCGQLLLELPVILPSQLIDYPFQKILVASEYFEKIRQQLLDMGIASNKIVILSATQIKAFHFGTDESTTAPAVAILQAVCDSLGKANIGYYVDAGTLLGIFRDGALIPWDDDLDIAVSSNEIDQTQQILDELLVTLHLITGEQWQCSTYLAAQDFGAVRKGDIRSLKLHTIDESSSLPMMDVFVKYIDGEWMDYTLSSRGIRMPSEHLLQLDSIDFVGTKLNIPGNTEAYLERHYGDWRTPKKDWDLSELKNATVY